jgi:hypothetical protein
MEYQPKNKKKMKVNKFGTSELKKLVNGDVINLCDEITVKRNGRHYTVTYGDKCDKVTVSNIYNQLKKWWEEENKVWAVCTNDNGCSYLVFDSKDEYRDYRVNTINDWIKGELNTNLFHTYLEDKNEDGLKCFKSYVSMFNRDKEITIEVVDMNIVHMDDEDGNFGGFVITPEYFDWYEFNEMFFGALENLLHKTLTDTFYEAL